MKKGALLKIVPLIAVAIPIARLFYINIISPRDDGSINYERPQLTMEVMQREFTLTKDWSEMVHLGIEERANFNTYRDDVWHEVAYMDLDDRWHVYEVPPWRDWEKLGWKAPTYNTKILRWRLSSKNSVDKAQFVYTICHR